MKCSEIFYFNFSLQNDIFLSVSSIIFLVFHMFLYHSPVILTMVNLKVGVILYVLLCTKNDLEERKKKKKKTISVSVNWNLRQLYLLTLSVWTGCAAKKRPARKDVFGARFNLWPSSSRPSPPISIANTSIIRADMTAWRMMFRTWNPTGWRPPAMRWFSLQWQDKEKLHATCAFVAGKAEMDV